MQTARLTELDHQNQATVQHTLDAAKARRTVQAQSEATDRENARLRALVAAGQATVARLRRVGDSLTASLRPVLAALPDSVSGPVLRLLAVKDSVIATQGVEIQHLNTVIDNVTADKDRWVAQDRRDADLASLWETQAGRWEKESKRGCLPIVGCLGRTTALLVGVALGGGGTLLLKP